MTTARNPLLAMAVAAAIFVHFKHPDTKAPIYLQKEKINPETNLPELDPATQEPIFVDDLEKPVGVRAYTPGSTVYRKVQADIATGTLQLGIKNMKGTTLDQNATALLAGTVYEFVNFDFNGRGASVEVCAALFDDPAYVAVREQVLTEQADLGNASRQRTKA